MWGMRARRPLELVVCSQRGVGSDGVVVSTLALDDDLSFSLRVEDLAIEQFIAQARSMLFHNDRLAMHTQT